VSGSEPLDWGALVPRLVHPTKVWVIEAMQWIDRPLSASELEMVFAGTKSVSALSYHVTSLAKAGVLKQVRRRQVRGAWESHYCFAMRVEQTHQG
jgi:hypothetical protein